MVGFEWVVLIRGARGGGGGVCGVHGGHDFFLSSVAYVEVLLKELLKGAR